jgi:hypothetical protein
MGRGREPIIVQVVDRHTARLCASEMALASRQSSELGSGNLHV